MRNMKDTDTLLIPGDDLENNFGSGDPFDALHSGIIRYTTDSEVFFAKERLKLHETTPEEGVSIEVLKKYIYKKYGI